LEIERVKLFVTGAERAVDYVAALLPGEARISDTLTLRTSDGAVVVTRAFFPERDETETETEGDQACGEVASETAADVVANLLKRRGRP
jgi:hypothetical protein